MASFFPTIGAWYQDTTSQQMFEVVAVDEKNRTIEVQYSDGSIDEFDMDSWTQLDLSPAAAPEDANAGYGLPPVDEGWQNETSFLGGGMGNPLEFIEPDSFPGFDDF